MLEESNAALVTLKGMEIIYPGLFKAIGTPTYLSWDADVNAPVNFRAKYVLPLDFCHSYDPNVEIGDGNEAVFQGGLLNGILDNAMTMGVQVVTQGRFLTTLSMTCQFIAPSRPGHAYAEVDVTKVGATIAFASVKLYSDEECTHLTAVATSVNKLRRPSSRL